MEISEAISTLKKLKEVNISLIRKLKDQNAVIQCLLSYVEDLESLDAEEKAESRFKGLFKGNIKAIKLGENGWDPMECKKG